MTNEMMNLPAERVGGEVEKLLLKSAKPSVGFTLMRDLGLLPSPLAALVGCPQDVEWHPEGDVWVHTLMALDVAAGLVVGMGDNVRLTVLLATLCHDLGKPSTTEHVDGRLRSRGHEAAGEAPTLALLDSFGFGSVALRASVVSLVVNHLKPSMLFEAGCKDSAVRRLARKVDLSLLSLVARADSLGRGGDPSVAAMDWLDARAAALGVEDSAPSPLLLGRDLLPFMAPGKDMGAALAFVFELQLDGVVTDKAAALRAALVWGAEKGNLLPPHSV